MMGNYYDYIIGQIYELGTIIHELDAELGFCENLGYDKDNELRSCLLSDYFNDFLVNRCINMFESMTATMKKENQKFVKEQDNKTATILPFTKPENKI